MSIIRNPNPASLSWPYNSDKIVRSTPSPPPGGCHRGRPLEPNLGLDRLLCAFRLHHLPEAIFGRHEYEQKPTEILLCKRDLGGAITITPAMGLFAKKAGAIYQSNLCCGDGWLDSVLDGVMGGDEEDSEMPEPLKVRPTAFFKLVR
jgi:hypothetical protein